jgi:hypothetical protein
MNGEWASYVLRLFGNLLHLRHVFLCGLCSILPANFTSMFAQDHREQLKIAADNHQLNREKVRTWSGTVKLTDYTILTRHRVEPPDVTTEIMHHEADFALRAEPRMLRWDLRWDVHRDADAPEPRIIASRGLVRNGELTELLLHDGGELPKRIRVMAEKQLSVGPTSATFDPVYFLGPWGENVADRLNFIYRQRGSDWTVERDGPLLTVTRDVAQRLNRYVVSLDQGATPVRFEASDGQGESWEWEYQKIDDVWLPRRLTYQDSRFEALDNRRAGVLERTRIRHIDWIETKVNEPIPEAEFTYDRLGIEVGDTIRNDLTGETYRYRKEE